MCFSRATGSRPVQPATTAVRSAIGRVSPPSRPCVRNIRVSSDIEVFLILRTYFTGPTLKSCSTSTRRSRRRRGALLCRLQDRIDHTDIAGAAAEVPAQHFSHLPFGGLRIVMQECLGGDQDARRAISALQPVMAAEGFLQVVESPVGRRQAADRLHTPATGLHSKGEAAACR